MSDTLMSDLESVNGTKLLLLLSVLVGKLEKGELVLPNHEEILMTADRLQKLLVEAKNELSLSNMTDEELVQKFDDLKKNPGVTASRIKFSGAVDEELKKRGIDFENNELDSLYRNNS